jgi:hypothetical protein
VPHRQLVFTIPKRLRVYCRHDRNMLGELEHLVRYYGWYSHRQRGIRKTREQSAQAESDSLTIDCSALEVQDSSTGGGSESMSTWAMLIKRVYEVDPMECPCCGGQMKFVSFIERCRGDVIEKILRHCCLWEGPLRTNASARAPPVGAHRVSADPPEPKFVPDPDYLDPDYLDPDYLESESSESASRKSREDATRELQLVLDPEFL